MEKSANYNFNLPNSANDEIADINDISDNFRIIDEKLAIDQTFSETSENPQSGTAIAGVLSGYVSAEVGKGLSSNDYTNEEKEKLAGIEAGAEVNAPVDTTYIPTSQNAQSGIAVAQAVDTCSPAIVTASDTGKALSIPDSSESVIKGLTAYGESTQDGTPTPDSPVEIASVENPTINIYGKNLIPYPYINTTKTINGIIFTDNGDGSITVNGTATANAYFILTALNLYPKGIYYLSGGASGGGISSYALTARNGEGASYTFLKYDYGSGVKIELSEDDTLMFEIRVYSGATVDNLVFKPQLELGAVATSYEPYVEPQTVTIPYTFRGLKNTTTGQWSARDELRVGDGKVEIVRNIASIIIDETFGKKVHLQTADTVKGFYIIANEGTAAYPSMKKQPFGAGLCSIFPNLYGLANVIADTGIVFGAANQTIYFINTLELFTTEDDFVQYFTENPFEIVYWRDTPEIEDITATEAGQELLALKTNYPTTSVISDIDLNLTYRADTKNYIDNKIAALTAMTLEG